MRHTPTLWWLEGALFMDSFGRLIIVAGLSTAILAPIAGADSGAREAAVAYRLPTGSAPALISRFPSPVRLVCIDPGHGGESEGAIGHFGVVEKELALDVSRRLGRILESKLGYAVIYTRDGDLDLDLTRRPAIANEAGADLFLSIHANAASTGSANGFETFFLSAEAGDKAARKVAARENRTGGGRPVAPFGGGPLGMILADLAVREAHTSSAHLAGAVQTELGEALDTANRGVKQAPFAVLVGALMPAVLIEIGFLSSRIEAKLLRRGDYRERVARAIAAGIVRFDSVMAKRMEKAPRPAG